MSGLDFEIPGIEDMSNKIQDSDLFGDNGNVANEIVSEIVNSENEIPQTAYQTSSSTNMPEEQRPKRKYTKRAKSEGSSYRSIDDLDDNEVEFVYKAYSTKPTAFICEKLNLSKRGVTSLMNRIHENIRNAVAHGDLTEEQYKKLEPMFSAYVETKVKVNRVDNLVNKIIGGMNHNVGN